MATWTTPKTDWYGATVDGVYSGDYFNYTDYNRIKNNIECLKDLAESLYNGFSIDYDELDDKTVKDYLYADEINSIESNFDAINAATLDHDYGSAPTYYSNGIIIDYTELNRLESAILDLYNLLTNQSDGRRRLSFYLSSKGEFF